MAGNAAPIASRDGGPGGIFLQANAFLPSVSTKAVNQITSTSATSGGRVLTDGGSTVTARGVCWSTSPNPTIDDSHTVNGSGIGTFNSSIEGLIPGQEYYVRAYATNSVGTAYGEEVRFVTNCIPYETWDTIRISQSQLPYTYRDTVLGVGTPDSISFSLNYRTMYGCDSTIHIKLFFYTFYVTACNKYEWSATGQTYTESGTYIHSYTDAQGHPLGDTLHLTILAPAVTLGSIPPVSVCLHQPISIATNATGNGNISYSWTGPNQFTSTSDHITIPNATTNQSGNYTVTAMVMDGPCKATATAAVSVTVHPLPTVHIAGKTSICEGESTELSASGAQTYAWSTGGTNPTVLVSPAVSTNYSVTGTDGNGCSNNASFTVTVGEGTDDTINVSACESYTWYANGQTYTESGTYSTTFTNGTGCLSTHTLVLTITHSETHTTAISKCESYTWPVNGQTYTESGTYTYSYTNANQCETTEILNLSIHHGTHTEMTVSECESYTWTATDQTYTGSGNHVYEYYNSDGCPSSQTLHLTIYGLPHVGISGRASICSGESVTLAATGAQTYQWSNGSTGVSISDAPENTTTYAVTGTDIHGCSNNASFTVIVSKSSDDTISVSACESYTWLANGQTYTESGVYSATFINEAGCLSTHTLFLTINHNETHTTNISECESYTWLVTGQTYTESGTYTYSYTNANQCETTEILNLTIHKPTVTLGNIPPVSVCLHQTISIAPSATGNGDIAYSWTGPNQFTSTSDHITLPNATANQSGNYILTATVSQGSCKATATKIVSVTVHPLPTVHIAGKTSICEGESTELSASGAQTYVWSTGGTSRTVLVSPTVNTNYSVTGTDGNGCSNNASFTVVVGEGTSDTINVSACESYTWYANGQTYTESGIYSTTFTNSAGCLGTHTLILTITHNETHTTSISRCDESYTWPVNGQTYTESGTYTYSYINANQCETTEILNLTIHHGTHTEETITECESYTWAATGQTYTRSGNHVYEYNNSDGCPSSQTLHLTIYGLPQVGISGGGSICSGESVMLAAAGAQTYQWSNGFTGSSFTDAPSSNMTYAVTGTDIHGCTATATASVIVNPLPSVFILGGAMICKGESVTLTATGAQSYSWNTGSAGNSITQSPTASTTYSVVGVDANMCRSFASVFVTVNELPIVSISGDDKICEGESTELTASGAKTYVWSTGSTAKTILEEPTDNITYTVTGTDENNCKNTASFAVTVGEGSEDSVEVTACEIYRWNVTGEAYTHSGKYYYTYMNDSGCESMHTLILTINHEETNESSVTKCGSYMWPVNNQTYTESGTYSYTYLNENQCAVTEILHLTIHEGDIEEETVSECDSYFWLVNGQTYTESGNHVFRYTNSHGCPSSKTLHLTILKGTNDEIYETAFDKYTWAATGFTYRSSGDYVYRYFNENGCESTTTLHLTIKKKDGDKNCMYARMEKEESCDPGKDGEVSIYIPEEIRGQCVIEWRKDNSLISNAPYVTGLSKGTYSVKVKHHQFTNVVFYKKTVEVTKKKDCDLKVKVTGPTDVQGGCNGIPSVTFTASASGGKQPYSFHGWRQISNTSAVKTITPSEGYFSVTCSVTDANNAQASNTLDGWAKKLECAKDPNEIRGPNGYSDENRFVNATDKMNYTIEFENDPDFAMAPASRVKITYDVPDQQKISSFRLADFGFGSFIFNVPTNASSYSQRLDVSDSLGVWVDVNAGIDIQNHQLFWIFQSIDPATGAEPVSSQMGFLPINDSLEHGQGYVSFYINPEANVHTGDTVGAEALIVFDDNAAIGTNVWTNTFDAVAPTSMLHADLNAQDSLYCTFSFEAQDDAGGSGVREVGVYMSVNNAAYTLIGSTHPDSTFSYTLENGVYYQFMSIATDNVGNKEDFKPLADTSVNYNEPPIDLVLNGNTFYEYGPVNSYVGEFYTLDNDVNLPFVYELVSGDGDTDNALFTIDGNLLRTASTFVCSPQTLYSIRVRTTDIGGLSLEKSFMLNEILQHVTPSVRVIREICQGDNYVFHNRVITESGTYADTLQTSAGCDSIVTLYLTVNPLSFNTFTATACDSFRWNDSLYTQSGDYIQTLRNANGCDSTVTLHLTVNYSQFTSLVDTICQGETYMFFGNALTTAGFYTDTVLTTHGCDSIVTLALTVNPVSFTQFSDTACDQYVWNDAVYTQSGDYTQTFTNRYGCDSTVTLHLTLYFSTLTAFHDTICQGETYTFFGRTLTTAGFYTDTLHTIHGCDSVFTLNLTVNPTYNVTDRRSICENALPYVWNNKTFTTAGTQTATLQTVHGCDSTVTMTLTVNPVYETPIAAEICQGESYNFFGKTLTTAGVYRDTLPTIHGCDSVIILTLTVHPTYETPMAAEICQGESYNFFGKTLTTAGIYRDTLRTVKGCDSVIVLTLTVHPSYETPVAAEICQGESYNFFGKTLTATGIYRDTLPTIHSCDSVIALTLTVHPTYNVTDSRIICESALPIVWNNKTFTAAGTQTATLQTVHGCDSTVTMTLTVNPVYETPVAAEICQGEGYNFYGKMLTATGVYRDTLPTIHGCDSVIVLTLTVHPTYETPVAAEICQGESYNFFNKTLTTAGVYRDTLQTVKGCDSVIVLTLTVHPVYETPVAAEICQGENYNFFGKTLTATGIYRDTLPTIHNCDSVIALTLTVHPTYNVTDRRSVCESALPIVWNNKTFTAAGTQTATLQTVHGCDSIVTMTLTVNPVYETPVAAEICQGESYNFFGKMLTTTGIYRDTLPTIHGCDSIIVLTLIVHPTYNVTDRRSICESALPIVWNNKTFTAAGTQTATLQTVYGCDSIVTMTLTVNPVYETPVAAEICQGESYNFFGNNLTATGVYRDTLSSIHACDSIIVLSLTVNTPTTHSFTRIACDNYTWNDSIYTQSGDYTQVFTNANGCDSIVTLHLNINSSSFTTFTRVACDSYTWNDSTYTQSGNYTQILSNEDGCDSIVTLHLTINPSSSTQFADVACNSYTWNDSIYTQSGVYTQTLTNANGCDSVVTLQLTLYHATSTSMADTICQGESYNFFGNNLTATGIYRDTLPTIHGCDSVITLTLIVLPLPTPSITGDNEICEGDMFTLTATGGTQYLWSTGATTNQITGSDAGSYSVTVTDQNGCSGSASHPVNVIAPTYSDFTIATPDSCYHWNTETYCASGDYMQTLQAANGCDSIVTLHLSVSVGVNDYLLDNNVIIYPNPTNDILNVRFSHYSALPTDILLYDAYGKLLQSVPISSEITQIDLTPYAKGIYFVEIIAEGRIATVRKAIKK